MMDRSLFDTARRRPVLLLAAATTLFIALQAVEARADAEPATTVMLCANPGGQLTIAPQNGCPPNRTELQVATSNGMADATAALEAADETLAGRLDRLQTTVEGLVTANRGLTAEVAALEAANTELTDGLGQAEDRIDQLESLVSELEDLVDRSPDPVDVTADVEELQATFAGVTRDDDTLVFDGMNVRIVNGTGTTTGNSNGTGNLVIGYDTARPSGTNDKSGSHYLVIGDQHNYTQYGGIVAGFNHTASNVYASVSGGHSNTAAGDRASILGGDGITVSESFGTSPQ